LTLQERWNASVFRGGDQPFASITEGLHKDKVRS